MIRTREHERDRPPVNSCTNVKSPGSSQGFIAIDSVSETPFQMVEELDRTEHHPGSCVLLCVPRTRDENGPLIASRGHPAKLDCLVAGRREVPSPKLTERLLKLKESLCILPIRQDRAVVRRVYDVGEDYESIGDLAHFSLRHGRPLPSVGRCSSEIIAKWPEVLLRTGGRCTQETQEVALEVVLPLRYGIGHFEGDVHIED